MLLGKFHYCQWPNIEEVKQPSGHTARIQDLTKWPNEKCDQIGLFFKVLGVKKFYHARSTFWWLLVSQYWAGIYKRNIWATLYSNIWSHCLKWAEFTARGLKTASRFTLICRHLLRRRKNNLRFRFESVLKRDTNRPKFWLIFLPFWSKFDF